MLMWMDFETKMRTLIMNMINPVMDMVTEDRIIIKRIEDTDEELLTRVKYLEDIVLYNKRIQITNAKDNIEKPESTIGSNYDSDDSNSKRKRKRAKSPEPKLKTDLANEINLKSVKTDVHSSNSSSNSSTENEQKQIENAV